MTPAVRIAGMARKWTRPYLAAPLIVAILSPVGPARSQGSGDTIGDLVKTSTFSSTEHVNVGKSNLIKQACFFREEGSSHMLDIGVSAEGAFIRLAYGDGPLPAESIPTPPLQVFAGKQLTKLTGGDMKATDEYEPIRIYDGAVSYTPNLATGYGSGFIVVTSNAKSFLEMVARARGEFVVVRSASEPRKADVVAIYDFRESTASALLSCASKLFR